MTMQTGQVIATLKALYEACKDGENGYRMAASRAKNEELRHLFQTYAEQRVQYAGELREELERRGGHDEKTATIGGALHQGWAEIKAAVTGGDDKALLAECERAEAVADKLFEEALKQELPADVQALVRRQFAGVKQAGARIQELGLVVK